MVIILSYSRQQRETLITLGRKGDSFLRAYYTANSYRRSHSIGTEIALSWHHTGSLPLVFLHQS